MAVDKERLAALMSEGEHMRPQATLVSIITMEGNKGVFVRRNVGDEGYEKPVEIGQTFSGVIVGVRLALSEYKPKSIKGTPEYTHPNTDRVALFERKGKDAKAEKIDEGTPVSLKARHKELRQQVWLYMLLTSGEIAKFKVKGSGLKHWYAFLRELSKRKLHTFEVKAKLDPVMETNEELGKDYYAPVFSIEKQLDDVQIERYVESHIGKLAGEFEAIAKYRAEQAQAQEDAPEELPVVQLDEEAEEDMPPLAETARSKNQFKDEEEIKPEDIPF